MRTIRYIVPAILMMLCWKAEAQRFSISANLLDYAALGTLNADVSYSLTRRWSLTAGARYNPFTFRKGDPERQFQYKQQSYSAGVRMWPWHAGAGWWFAGKMRYQEYNIGGIISPETREGDRLGVGVYAGYTYMLGPHFNLEMGLGVWAGSDRYRLYSCPICGVTLESGNEVFLLPDDIMLSLVYVF